MNVDATEDRCLHFYDRMNIIAYLVSSDQMSGENNTVCV